MDKKEFVSSFCKANLCIYVIKALIGKETEDMHRALTVEDIQIVNKHMNQQEVVIKTITC